MKTILRMILWVVLILSFFYTVIGEVGVMFSLLVFILTFFYLFSDKIEEQANKKY